MKLEVSVTDGTNGQPADGLSVRLEQFGLDGWRRIWKGTTGEDGRSGCAVNPGEFDGFSRLTLETDRYFATLGLRPFYSHITVELSGGEPHDRQELSVVLTPHGFVVCGAG
ncbi:hydroxyisourate hydrolase [Streptomyces uncialis]|uniref:hydroxyisourate hydrolase n=1 Tax=Streptomyces uncialis TaxID=1048205 RepID=UPI0033CC04DC